MSQPPLPAPDCDLLSGIPQIAAWAGLTLGQCRERIAAEIFPTFRVRGSTTVYAFKSEIVGAMRDHAKKARMPVKKVEG